MLRTVLYKRPTAAGSLTYIVLKYLHVIGATVILGTGAGIAFFMLMAHRTANAEFIARTAGTVVNADVLFTATAVILQPITGYLLVREMGLSLTDVWIAMSLALYCVAGIFWLPVVFIQARMRDLARASASKSEALSAEYHRLFRLWVIFGFPGFGSVMAIIWLMIAKPTF